MLHVVHGSIADADDPVIAVSSHANPGLPLLGSALAALSDAWGLRLEHCELQPLLVTAGAIGTYRVSCGKPQSLLLTRIGGSGQNATTSTATGGTAATTVAMECTEPGQDCTVLDCCEGSTCVSDGVVTVCADNCSGAEMCRSQCCAPVAETIVSVCSPPEYCDMEPTGTSVGACLTLIVLGYDGQFLGVAESNPYGADSVCNEFGTYGSEFSSSSIYNSFGTYGSEFNTLSAYNSSTTTPPALLCDETGETMALVTKNTTLTGGIDPDILCIVLAENGY